MEQFTTIFLDFIGVWGYMAVAILMGLENACVPIPSELILGFACEFEEISFLYLFRFAALDSADSVGWYDAW